MQEYDDFKAYCQREKIRAPEKLSKLIEELVRGKMVETENGNIAKSVGHQLKHLKTKGILKTAYNGHDKISYLWLEKIPREWEKKKQGGFGGCLYKLIFGE